MNLKYKYLLIIVSIIILVLIGIFSLSNSNIAYQNNDSAMNSGIYEDVDYRDYIPVTKTYPETTTPVDVTDDLHGTEYIKKTTMINEVISKEYDLAVMNVQSIVSEAEGYILTEKTATSTKNDKIYFRTDFVIKVPVENYSFTLIQFKNIGEIYSFNESISDVSSKYNEDKLSLEDKKKELAKYQLEKTNTSDTTRIAELDILINKLTAEIKSMEDNFKSLNLDTQYSTFNLSIVEDGFFQSKDKVFKFGSNFLESGNLLFSFLGVILPWLLALILIIFLFRISKNKNKK